MRRHRPMVVCAALFSSFLPTGHAFAQETLTLSEVLARVEANYPKLRGAEFERQAATAKRVAKQGAFDPVAIAGSEYLRFNSTTKRGKEANTTMSDVGVEVPLRNGMKLAAGARYNFGSTKSPESNTGGTGEYFVSVKLPLLRGQGLNEKAALERQAFLGEPLATQNLAAFRLTTLANAAFSYWDWVAAGQKVSVARNLLTIAETRAAQIRARVERGDLPAIDAVEADQEVERRRGSFVKAERDAQKAAFKLGLYLWTPEGQAAPTPEIPAVPATLPTPEPLDAERTLLSQDKAVIDRPEVEAIALAQEVIRVDLALARNDMQPSIDLVLSPGVDTGSKSVGDTLKAGVMFSLPLYQREARGRHDEAALKLQKLAQDESLLKQQIRLEVADAANAVNTTFGRYEAARRELDLAQRLEQGERDRFALGDSTLFLVNQRERATAEANQRLIDVMAEYQQALAAFRAASAAL